MWTLSSAGRRATFSPRSSEPAPATPGGGFRTTTPQLGARLVRTTHHGGLSAVYGDHMNALPAALTGPCLTPRGTTVGTTATSGGGIAPVPGATEPDGPAGPRESLGKTAGARGAAGRVTQRLAALGAAAGGVCSGLRAARVLGQPPVAGAVP